MAYVPLGQISFDVSVSASGGGSARAISKEEAQRRRRRAAEEQARGQGPAPLTAETEELTGQLDVGPSGMPGCLLPGDKAAAAKACAAQPELRGLGALPAGLDPCALAKLPVCPPRPPAQCLTNFHFDYLTRCILGMAPSGADANAFLRQCATPEARRMIDWPLCPNTQRPRLPKCRGDMQDVVIDYCGRYRYGGRDKLLNAACYGLLKGYPGKSAWEQMKKLPRCYKPKALTCVGPYQRQWIQACLTKKKPAGMQRARFEEQCASPEFMRLFNIPVCKTTKLPKRPTCMDPRVYRLALYCAQHGASGPNPQKNWQCYVISRTPGGVAALKQLAPCPKPKVVAEPKPLIRLREPGKKPRPHVPGKPAPARAEVETVPPVEQYVPAGYMTAATPPPSAPPEVVEAPVLAPPEDPEIPPTAEVGAEPVKAGMGMGGWLLLLAAAGGGYYLWQRRKRAGKR